MGYNEVLNRLLRGSNMRSMTGFGRGTGNDGKLAVTIEMRAVNQRFLELNIRMPHAYLALEVSIAQRH